MVVYRKHMHTSLVIVLLVCAGGKVGCTEEYQLPDRVYCDHAAGISFTYPYQSFVPDPCVAHIRSQAGLRLNLYGKTYEHVPDVTVPEQVLRQFIPGVYRWKECDYYEGTGRRSFAQKKWAGLGIIAYEGRAAGSRVRMVFHHQRVDMLVLSGINKDTDTLAERCLQSMEVLGSQDGVRMRYNSSQSSEGQVYGHDGIFVDAKEAPLSRGWQEPWQIESAHFHFSGIAPTHTLWAYATHLEGVLTFLQQWFPIEQQSPYKWEIHLTKTLQQFRDMSGEVPNAAHDAIGIRTGFFNPMSMALYTLTDRQPKTTGHARLHLAHEATHLYILLFGQSSQSLPVWLSEGLAVLFENTVTSSEKPHFGLPRRRLKILKMYYKQRQKTVKPLANYILDFAPISVQGYAESYAMLHYLLSQDEKGGARLRLFWKMMRSGQAGTDAFYDAFFREHEDEKHDIRPWLARWNKKLYTYVCSGKVTKALRLQEE